MKNITSNCIKHTFKQIKSRKQFLLMVKLSLLLNYSNLVNNTTLNV